MATFMANGAALVSGMPAPTYTTYTLMRDKVRGSGCP
jgi:hypothetical protein